ncbi:DUF4238 domain-containing protein [Ruegeria atlantica]|uniref:DUF4238 domain-containing protein n=1 Tax=Ruegeria atlantica TaxID=81569 RepID=UPI00147EC1FF|nr:DUF4238 domain-containing protein [Ruegeria atlantica]
MSSKRIKNHHFLPQVLQRQFLNDQGQIWYAEKGSDGFFLPPESRNTKSAFKIKDYYTVLDDGAPSDIVEKKFYGPIDNYLGHLLTDVNAAFDNGDAPTFSGEALHNIRLFLFETIKRSPEFINDYDDTLAGRDFVERMIQDPRGDLDQTEKARLEELLQDHVELKRYGRDIRVQGMIRRSTKVEAALEDFSVRWAVSLTHNSFILSSMIAYRIGNGGANGLVNPNMEIWMPVHPKRALVLLRDPKNEIPLVTREHRDHIREINQFAAAKSQSIASHSRKLIESLTGKSVAD